MCIKGDSCLIKPKQELSFIKQKQILDRKVKTRRCKAKKLAQKNTQMLKAQKPLKDSSEYKAKTNQSELT